jgi:DNA-binding XRE family transcriptional regulator
MATMSASEVKPQDSSASMDPVPSEIHWIVMWDKARRELVMPQAEPTRLTSLTQMRLSKGWTQRDLAQLVGTSQSHIARIEGRACDPHLSTVAALAKALEIDVGELAKVMVGQVR